MALRGHGFDAVTLVILLILAGLVVTTIWPDAPWGSRIFWLGAAIGGVILARIAVEIAIEARDAARKRALLRELAGLRGAADTEAAAVRADALLRALDAHFLGLPDLEGTPELLEAARADGPQRVACLRLVLRHAWVGPPKWQETLREGAHLLESAPLDPEERDRLRRWREMDAALS